MVLEPIALELLSASIPERQPPSAKADGLSLPDPAGRDDRLVD